MLTHTISNKMMESMKYFKENNYLNVFLDMLQERLSYSHWYAGHFHCNETIMNKHTILYEKIIKIGEDNNAFKR